MKWALIFMILASLAVPTIVYPTPPAVYYGRVNGCSLPSNTYVKAMVGEEERGRADIVNGVYGGSGYGEGSLAVTLYTGEDVNVNFMICNPYGCATVGTDHPNPGEMKRMDFNLSSSQCSSLQPPEEEEGGRGTGGGGGGGTVITIPEVEEMPPSDLILRKYSWMKFYPGEEEEVEPEGMKYIRDLRIRYGGGVRGSRVVVGELSGTEGISPVPWRTVSTFFVSMDPESRGSVEEVIIEFSVPVGSVSDPSLVRLAHYVNGEWILEETEFVGEENGEYIFRARVTHFSYFAIVELEGEKPQCTSDQNCLGNQKCVDGNCVEIECHCGYIENHECVEYQCCSDGDCSPGYTCQDHQCVKVECESNADCPGDQMCSQGECVPVPCECGEIKNHECVGYECCSDNDCPGGECKDHRCATGFSWGVAIAGIVGLIVVVSLAYLIRR